MPYYISVTGNKITIPEQLYSMFNPKFLKFDWTPEGLVITQVEEIPAEYIQKKQKRTKRKK